MPFISDTVSETGIESVSDSETEMTSTKPKNERITLSDAAKTLGYSTEYFRFKIKKEDIFTPVRDRPAARGVKVFLLRDEVELALTKGFEAVQAYRRKKGRIKTK